MSPKEAMERIVAIEQQCDVNAVRYRGLKVWPLIRLSLWSQLHQPAGNIPTHGPGIDLAPPLNGPAGWMRGWGRILQLASPAGLWRLFQSRRTLRRLQGNVDLVFLSRPEDHADRINGKFVNRHVDPMVDFLRGKWRCVKIEPASPSGRAMEPRLESTVYFDPRYRLLKTALLSLATYRDSIDGFQDLQRVIQGVTGGCRVEERDIIRQAQRLWAYMGVFTEWLSRLRPKAAFVVCYYDVLSMAMVAASKKLRIRTVDIQHGKQGKYHGLYTHWTRIPGDGYDLLPDFFWSWGSESKKNIEKWLPANSLCHRPVLGGNRWLAMWRDRDLEEGDTSAAAFYETFQGFAKIILVTLQPMGDPLPAILLDAMRKSQDEWRWLIRLHPLSKELAGEIINTLKENGIYNFEVHWSTVLPLYGLLKRVHHHITCWSSVCYETLAFHVPTTIVHPTGLELYEDYIRRGIFGYAESGSEILRSIAKPAEEGQFVEPTPYIEIGDEPAKQAMEIILNGTGTVGDHAPAWAS